MVEKNISNKEMIATIILFASTFFIFESLFSQLPDNNRNNAFAQSELIATTSGNNAPSTNIFNLTTGYAIEPVIWNLTAPDSVTFDDNGNMYIGEAGYPFTNIPQVPRILKMEPNGNLSIFVDNKLNSPIVDITFHDGLIYVSHRGKISTVNTTNGQVDDLIIGLNQNGDHPNNQIAFSPDGKRFFFGTGSATNSGVVGEDDFRWYTSTPGVPDVPAKNITLTDQNFHTSDLLTAEPNDNATTGAFVPFNTTTKAGQVIKGQLKCNACILSANLDGTDLRLVGWGLRNPSGLAFNEDGRLFTANHGADERGSRPIANDNDRLYEIKLNETAFYGWPDFFRNAEPVNDPKFQIKGSDKPLQFVMQNHPPVEKPLVLFEPAHTAVIQMAFANKSFGFEGEAFVAQIGSHAPPPGTTVGQNVVHVNIDNKTVSDFISLKNPTTIFRPTDIAFSQDGTAMYIVDWGNLREPGPGDTIPNSGIVWKITPTIQR